MDKMIRICQATAYLAQQDVCQGAQTVSTHDQDNLSTVQSQTTTPVRSQFDAG